MLCEKFLMQNHKLYGVLIAEDCRGVVTMIDNIVQNNKRRDINNDASEKYCKVTLDGDIYRTPGLILRVSCPEQCRINTPKSLKARAKVELDNIKCSSCDFVQPVKEKCRTCGQCQLTRYCSKECQKKHWKDGGHKLSCVKYIEHP
jgi:hypothetical protein